LACGLHGISKARKGAKLKKGYALYLSNEIIGKLRERACAMRRSLSWLVNEILGEWLKSKDVPDVEQTGVGSDKSP